MLWFSIECREHVPKVYVYRNFKTVAFAAADRDSVNATFGSEGAFQTFFGGCELYGGTYLRPEFLGVWGARNVSRFRRLLRQRFGKLEVVESERPVAVRSYSTTGMRLSREQREEAEREMRLLWPSD